MLSRKQRWRKQVLHVYKEEIAMEVEAVGDKVPSRSFSEPKIETPTSYNNDRRSRAKSLDSLSPRRRVNFTNVQSIILIETRDEYENAGLCDRIWWNDIDYSEFKASACSEVIALMSIDKNIDCRVAQEILYQPHYNNSTRLSHTMLTAI